MLNETSVEAFNNRINVNLNNIKDMTPGQQDKVKAWGSQAENLLKNKDLALFIHTTKFEIMDLLSAIKGHTQEDNNKRVALSNQLSGLESFIVTLKQAAQWKNRVVANQATAAGNPQDPAENTNERTYQ